MLTQMNFFEHIFRKHTAIMLISDANSGRMLDANDAALEFYGYTLEEMRQLHRWDIAMASQEDLRHVINMIRTAEKRSFRLVHKLANGELRHIETDSTTILLETGVAVYSIVRDITQEVRLAEMRDQMMMDLANRERRLRDSQRMARIGSWEWNMQSNLVDASDELLRLLGLAEGLSPLPFEYFFGAIHPDDRDRLEQRLREATTEDEPFEVIYRVNHPSDGELILSTQGKMVRDVSGAPQWLVGTTQDITMSKRTEDELREYARQLEANMRESEEFAYVASHDLQEPLRKIRTFGDRLKQLSWDKLDDTSQNYLERMLAAASRMSKLIEDLLSYSRVSTRGQSMEQVALSDVLRDVKETLAVSVEEARGVIELEGELPVMEADRRQIEQLFQNLISNALKFRRPDTAPRIKLVSRVLGEVEGERRLELVVQDNGIGFEPKYSESIFAPFHRLHGRDAYPGTGIGLAICRKIAERHHGTITASSTPGQGARFVIKLPLSQSLQLPALTSAGPGL